MEKNTGLEIAVIGMAGRFPGADNIAQYWENLIAGKDCVSDFTNEEVLEEGEAEALINNPNYVRSHAYLESKHLFDAGFFGYLPNEAELMDPQIRIFHEVCWQALEDSGYGNSDIKEKVGLFASGAPNINWELHAYCKNREGLIDEFTASHLRAVNFLSSSISYKLNLRGPSVYLQTACSSSLVAIHEACNSLLLGECTMALAGGIRVNNFSKRGYLYEEGMIMSRDGRCRPFDIRSNGTIGGEGAGVIVLKRLRDALRDRDTIHAIVKGTGINNDGNNKVGYNAPGVKGQAEAIKKAHKMAGVAPETIGYVEAHGTATELGDPIEIEALNEAFAHNKTKTCCIGSVKSNIGHLDTAAGVAGFIKTVLALKFKMIPPTLHYTAPNPKIDFDNGPFYVHNKCMSWESNAAPRRAGVSSFGIGGTNAHIVLEEAATAVTATGSRQYQLINISGKSADSLERNTNSLLRYLQNNQDTTLADIAYTLQKGRTRFPFRRMLVCADREEAIDMLANRQFVEHHANSTQESMQHIIFMFPGQGAQYVNMCKDLYLHEPFFKDTVDDCLQIAHNYSSADLYSVLFPAPEQHHKYLIHQTQYTQPLLFIIEYALAKLLMHWGIQPDYMIGHSIGEYVAACISGVFSLADALRLVIRRGELMSEAQPGAMLSIKISEEQAAPLIQANPQLNISVINTAGLLVVSGTIEDIEELEKTIAPFNYSAKRVITSHAFHSWMMDEILDRFEREYASVTIHEPAIPFVSNITGEIVTYEQLSQPAYWSLHLRSTVQFLKSVELLLDKGDAVFIEAGPGRALCNYLNENQLKKESHEAINIIRHSNQHVNDLYYCISRLGQLWLHGVKIDWDKYFGNEQRSRIPLPAYSFDQTAFTSLTDARKLITGTATAIPALYIKDAAQCVHLPSWQRSLLPDKSVELDNKQLFFLILSSEDQFSDVLVNYLLSMHQSVINVKTGSSFKEIEKDQLEVDLSSRESLLNLWAFIDRSGVMISHILFCLPLTEQSGTCEYDKREEYLQNGYLGLSYLARSIADHKWPHNIQITVINNYLANVMGEEEINPLKSTILGPSGIIPSEIHTISCKVIDIPYPFTSAGEPGDYARIVVNEIFYAANNLLVAYRNKQRWTKCFITPDENENPQSNITIAENGVYMIVGGFGGMGFTIANDLVHRHHANVILLHRSDFPCKEEWPAWLSAQDDKDAISKKIYQLMAMEETGCHVDHYQVDMSDEEQVSQFVTTLQRKYPAINGVIWAAGEADFGGIIQHRKPGDFIKYLSSKVHGILLLDKFLDMATLDFIVLFSSIGNTFYQTKFGQVAYNAANEFLEAFSLYIGRKTGVHAVTINWCDWYDVGMTVNTRMRELGTQDLKIVNTHISDGITPSEGLKLFYRCLHSRSPQATIFKGNIAEVIKAHRIEFNERKRSLAQPAEVIKVKKENIDSLQLLTEIFSTFFGRADIVPDDDFFELGGDSLKGMTLVARINQQTGAGLTIGDLYTYPTISLLAGEVDSHTKRSVPESIPLSAKKKSYVLSSAQKRLYFVQMLDSQSTVYNEVQLFHVTGKLDKDKLEYAFKQLISKHESLRTAFEMEDGVPRQVIYDEFEFNVEYYKDAISTPEDIVASFVRPFNLGTAPLCRAAMVERKAGEYLLLIDLHHIIEDAVSQSILIKDFIALYNGTQLLPNKIQYRDYAEWQQSESQQRKLALQSECWLQEFPEEPVPLNLPTDFARPLTKSYEGSVVDVLLSIEETRQLNSIARMEGASLFALLLAVYNIWLSKLSGQEDIVIGVSTAGRQHADLEDVMGLFINILPIRNYPTGEMGFRAFLSSVKAKVLRCFDNQDYPYEQLLDDLKVKRDTARNPLFDVMFVFQKFDGPALTLPGLTITPFKTEHRVSKFDIMLTVVEKEQQLLLSIEYSTDLFKKETIERWVGWLRQIITVIIAGMDTSIAGIEMITAKEKQWLLYALNDTTRYYPKHNTVLDLFEVQVEKGPDAIAVSYHNTLYTYRSLNEKANRIASYLRDVEQVKAGDMVGILFKRDEFVIPVILGILKAGAGYVPINPNYPAERITTLVDNARLQLIITRTRYRDASLQLPARMLDIDTMPDTLQRQSVTQLPAVTPQMTAYVIYTSGSTGKPKGVVIEHSSLLNYIYWAAQYYVTEKATFPLYTSLSFDLTVTSIFTPLITGNKIIIYEEIGKDIPVEKVFNDNEADIIKLTPSHLKIIRSSESVKIRPLNKKRKLIVGGEDLETQLALDIYNKFNGQVEIYNEYGPTEATVGCMIYKFDPHQSLTSVPIGLPINNTAIYILDKYLKPLPAGITGEMYVGGEGLASGYLFMDDKTQEKFMDDPFREKERMYRTGDMACRLSDGTVFFKGRVDDQVKIRGFRIELNEIETCLLRHTAIKAAIVVVRELELEKILIAYYTATEPINEAALREYLSNSLPEYMVPTRYVQLNKIPLTVNGKVNKNALPDPGQLIVTEYEPAVNKTEELLVVIWAAVLKLDPYQISVTKNFIELGGNSLKMILMVNKVLKEFNVSVSLNEAFNHQDIRSLANYILQLERAKYHPVKRTGTRTHYKLSSAQKRLYFLYEFDKTSLAYNMPKVTRIDGVLDKARLRDTFNKLIVRHEILRTAFDMTQDEDPVQKVLPSTTIDIAFFEAKEENIQSVVSKFIQPFDLSQAPLMRVGLISITDRQHLLMVDMHHIIADGVSQMILTKDFMSIYNDEILSDLELQYRDYAEWQQSEEQQQQLLKQKYFWLEVFATETSLLDLPADFPRPLVKNYKGNTLTLEIAADKTAHLRTVAEKEGTTLFMVMLSVYNILLSKLSNQEDIVIGIPTIGRSHADLENMIGMFINTLPLRNFPRPHLTFREFLAAVRSHTLACFENEGYQYEALIEELKVERNTSRNPLFDVLFSYQNFEETVFNIPGLACQPFETGHEMAKFDITLSAIEKQDRIVLIYEYSTELFIAETIQRFAAGFDNIIATVVNNVNVPLSDIAIITAEEKEKVLTRFNDTLTAFPADKTIVELFEEQAAKAPDLIALVGNKETLTYSELNYRANRLAEKLFNKGLLAGQIIGVMLPRTPDMLIAMLGILKTGCAYVPIDPDYPEDRIRYIVQDSNMDLLITEQDLENKYTQFDIPVHPHRSFSSSNMAYLIYTSGSTGHPKGVMIEHKSIVNFIYGIQSRINFKAGGAMLCLTTISFDIFVLETLLPLILGLKVVLANETEQKDPDALARLVIEQKVDFIQITPSYLKLLLIDRSNHRMFEQVKVLMVGGEAFPLELLHELQSIYKGRIYNMYGPTETTVWSAVSELTAATAINIGTPIANTTIRILGSGLQLQPIGVTGELFIGGEGLACGYWKNEALTSERFLPDPHNPGQRMYRTGDLARWLPNGAIECLGRTDYQVKIRGFRIELEEIEHQLLACDGIDEAVVDAKEHEGDKYLVAYYTANGMIDATAIKNQLLVRLPLYMVPSHYVQLDIIPLTPNGKINRRALPDPVINTDIAFLAPANDVEDKVAEIWAKVLNIEKEKISVFANFFDLGGHSLRIIKMSKMINACFDINLPVSKIFRLPNIHAIAGFIANSDTKINRLNESLQDRNEALDALTDYIN